MCELLVFYLYTHTHTHTHTHITARTIKALNFDLDRIKIVIASVRVVFYGSCCMHSNNFTIVYKRLVYRYYVFLFTSIPRKI